MPYPVPGMLIIASSTFEAYKYPDQIPEHDVERNDPESLPISISIGTRLTVASVVPPVIQLSPWGEMRHVWTSEDAVQRNTAPVSAVTDEDLAWLMEYRILHHADPDTIWAPRTRWEHLDTAHEDFDDE
jgi:hypothetical protein